MMPFIAAAVIFIDAAAASLLPDAFISLRHYSPLAAITLLRTAIVDRPFSRASHSILPLE
jgi:hypothetical protein